MYQTNYHRAASIQEAVQMMGAATEGKYLSGGMTLIPTMRLRLAAPSDLVDLRRIAELKGIAVDGRSVRIGAATTHEEVATSSALRAICPSICGLAGHIGDPAVRHMGTIGGSIANNDPAADYPAAMLALDAVIVTDRREIKAAAFFTGLFETALEEGEIITAVRFDAPAKAAYQKFPNPASRYAMAGVFVARRDNGDVRVGVTGAGSSGVFRHPGLEAALSANWSPDAVANVTVDASDLLTDLHASAAYRANLVRVMTKRAVAAA
ncbi:carbon-monoxide dehydrogenase [Sinorhizobium fredii USDA 205]|uniref:Carbon monoxide dehydrogenase n=1 Tax=Rhizobium fredii TaxID=380 RepID=A0A844AFW5_RHIFR|nr:xanthine dehydrogenase family protein subunit M [Sinorhizobium fredii]KSV87196.1 carbon-monoxide dehydrogenase [Sinorhizobium fredii USDA 205]MQX10556.1 carbon monoxide dehydrogenase [Sinorhizobium fredii]GEC34493.1 carbon monoxide dehydrogenase [Sinorhizobium fredii]GLS12449.1 carbon monoxide dehydrogenase [Sinorhizobium fredii]